MCLLSCINSTLQPHRWEQCKKNVLNTSKGGHYLQLIVTSRHHRFFQYTWRVLKVKETKSRREVQTALSFTTGFPLDILDAQIHTPQHHVLALEQYPEALDVSSSSMHKANSHMASPGCFLFLYRRDCLCRPRLRDRQPPTEAHQRRPPTAAKGNWPGLHRGTAAKRNFAASWVHKEPDTVRNGLMQARFQVKLSLLAYGRDWEKKRENANLLLFAHEVFCFYYDLILTDMLY